VSAHKSQSGGSLLGIRRLATAALAALLVSVTAVPVSTADDLSSLTHDLAVGSDFRVRVGAALSLGRTRSRAALAPLVNALEDGHPAVRAAAAAALVALGDKDAAEALRRQLVREQSPSVKAQIKNAIDSLSGARVPADGTAAKVLVKLGQLKNLTGGVRGVQLTEVFRGATRAKAAELPGVEVLSEASEGRHESELRRLPLLVLDGVVNRLAQGTRGTRVTVSAQVEYVFRKMPEHALRGSVTGVAQAADGSGSPQDTDRVAQLENQALRGAVESAMRGAPEVMLEALR